MAFAVAIYMFSANHPKVSIKLGDGIFVARVADTDSSRKKGLSGVAHLGANEGLLMVFDDEDTWDIWMKDMKVPLDIIWLDGGGEVVHRVKNAPIDDGEPRIFSPNRPARYVLEVPAGTIDSRSINIGSQADFDLSEMKGWWL